MPRPSNINSAWALVLRAVGRPWWLGLAVALVVLGTKLALIDAAGSDLPVWDQWDAEGAYLYRPYLEGTLETRTFFSPHNEHRILFTRLLALGLLELNGQWDGLLQMVVNAGLHAAFAGLVTTILIARLGRFGGAALAAVVAGLLCVPAAWENVLSGFQSQFYFLLVFTFVHIAGTALAKTGTWPSWLAQLAGGCALFTMASGLASAATVLVLIVLQAGRTRQWTISVGGLLLINVAWLALGLWLRVEHPGHEGLRADSAAVYLRSLGWMMAWPTRNLWLVPVLLLPFAALTVRWWKAPSPFRTLLLGLAGWWLLQLLVLAYARGTGVESPRYLDIFAFGLVIAAAAWIDWLGDTPSPLARWTARVAAGLWLALVGTTLVNVQIDLFRHLAPHLRGESRMREAVVRDHVQRPSARLLQREPGTELPYPWPDRFAALLAEPSLRKILPPSVRLPLPLVPDGTVTHGLGAVTLDSIASDAAEHAWGRLPDETTGEAVFGSRELRARTSRVLIRATGSAGELRLEPQQARPLTLPIKSATGWTTWTPPVGRGNFRLQASAPPDQWLAFTAPVEIGGVAWLARRTATHSTTFIVVGLSILVTGGIGRLRRSVGETPDAPLTASPRERSRFVAPP